MRLFCVFVICFTALVSSHQTDLKEQFGAICEQLGWEKEPTVESRVLLALKDHRRKHPELVAKSVQAATTTAAVVTPAPATTPNSSDRTIPTLDIKVPLKVGIAQYAPYTFQDNVQEADPVTALIESSLPGWQGFSIDVFEKLVAIWNAANQKAGLQPVSIEYVTGTYDENIDRLVAGEIDTFATGIFLTRRFREIYKATKFSIGFWQSGMGIMIPKPPDGPSILSALVSPGLWSALGTFFLGLFFFGICWYYIERETEEQQKDRKAKNEADKDPSRDLNVTENDFLPGVATGMWWTATTMTTVGYGDTFPKTCGGRVLAVVVMVASLFLVGIFTSQLTAAMTLQAVGNPNAIKSMADLKAKNVASVRGSFPYNFITGQGTSNVLGTDNMSDAIKLLLDGKADAVLGVSDVLNYWSAQGKAKGKVKLIAAQFHAHALVYPFVGGPAAPADTLAKATTDALLLLEDTETMDEIIATYFTPTQPDQ